MIDIEIKTIPHMMQRYPTVGDYFTRDDKTRFFISEMSNWRYETLVAIHEVVEQALTRYRGIAEHEIDDFDQLYELNRPDGDLSEPGDNPAAPYHYEHVFATSIERMVAQALGVNWEEYDRTVGEL
jgi:hypothetical protein